MTPGTETLARTMCRRAWPGAARLSAWAALAELTRSAGAVRQGAADAQGRALALHRAPAVQQDQVPHRCADRCFCSHTSAAHRGCCRGRAEPRLLGDSRQREGELELSLPRLHAKPAVPCMSLVCRPSKLRAYHLQVAKRIDAAIEAQEREPLDIMVQARPGS